MAEKNMKNVRLLEEPESLILPITSTPPNAPTFELGTEILIGNRKSIPSSQITTYRRKHYPILSQNILFLDKRLQ